MSGVPAACGGGGEFSLFLVSMSRLSVLVWNVRGLNNPAKRRAVKESVVNSHASVVCLQESKLEVVDLLVIHELCGLDFDDFVALPASHTRGGVIVAWKGSVFRGSQVHLGQWSVTAKLEWTAGNHSCFLTSVYGPQDDNEKILFLEELAEIRGICGEVWLVAGDFNLIAAAADKNNSRVNRRLMNAFRNKINELELKELYLFGRRYTWSSEQQFPTLVKSDRVPVSTEWEDAFPDAHLQALSSSSSDHCALLLSCGETPQGRRRFRFETFWTKLEDFDQVVADSWQQTVESTDPYVILYVKMARLAMSLCSWGQKKISRFRLQLQIANELIFRFDVAQENRLLSPLERRFRAILKGRCLALASLERIRVRQRARISQLREGDANSKYFHMKVNARRRKLFIPVFEYEGQTATSQEDKIALAKDYFQGILGVSEPNSAELQFNQIFPLAPNLQELEVPFSEEEVWKVIKEMPNEKAPGPDGFTGLFYQRCWQVIKGEVLAALTKFHSGNHQNLDNLNTAVITLLPKKDAPTLIKDYRPISLIHSFSKLATKILASRLAPRMGDLVAENQTAFIRGRSIHENFIFVRGLALQFHRRKKPMILLKLDITKAFDTVSWCFLLNLLRNRGFGSRWRSWIAALLLTSETRILLNGHESDSFKPARGLRQGNPLSPLLFVLVMDALQGLLAKATSWGLLAKLDTRRSIPNTSIYADDTIVFLQPIEREATAVNAILQLFGKATGLKTNLSKSALTPIRCDDDVLVGVQQLLGCRVENFPITYLGLPLSLRRPTKAEVQPILDRLSKKVAGWKPKLLSPDGRLRLIKSVLTALPVHFMFVLVLPKWAIKEFNKKCRAFLWKGQEEVNGGHCLVAWDIVCSPKECGGLGVKNLELFGQAMRMKWLARRLEQRGRPWTLINSVPTNDITGLFQSVASFQVGDGKDTDFWRANWLPRGCISVSSPLLFTHLGRTKLTVAEALSQNRWVRDIRGSLSALALSEYFRLWDEIQEVQLQEDAQDSISWKLTPNGVFCTASVYEMFFAARVRSQCAELIWQARGPSRLKFFMWLITKGRCLTADNLQKRGWPHEDGCVLCNGDQESCDHLLLGCPFTNRIWGLLRTWLGTPFPLPGDDDWEFADWWIKTRLCFQTGYRGAFDSLCILICWFVW